MNSLIESSRPLDSGIDRLLKIGSTNDNDISASLKPVHLCQQLIERHGIEFLVLGAFAGQRVQLINEDNTGSLLPSLFEQTADPFGPHSHKHFVELAARFSDKVDAGLIGDRLCQHRLAAAWRPCQQHASVDLGTDLPEFMRVL
jgi:hypothetical protein